jgi:hypothetical protein
MFIPLVGASNPHKIYFLSNRLELYHFGASSHLVWLSIQAPASEQLPVHGVSAFPVGSAILQVPGCP